MEHIAQLNADIQQNKQIPSLQETQSCEDDQFNLQQLLKQEELNNQQIEIVKENSQQTNSLNYNNKDIKFINDIQQNKLDVLLQDVQQNIIETEFPIVYQELSANQSLEEYIQKDENINQLQLQINNPSSSSISPSELFSYSQNQMNNKQSNDYIQSSQHTLSPLNSNELSQIPDFPQIGSPLDLSLLDLEYQQQLSSSEIFYNEIDSSQFDLYPTFPFESFISDNLNYSTSDQHSYLQYPQIQQDQQNQTVQIHQQLEQKDQISNKLSTLQITAFHHNDQPINYNQNQLIESQANIQDVQNNQNNNKQKENQSNIKQNQLIQSKYPPFPKMPIKLPPIPSPPKIIFKSDQQDQLQEQKSSQLTIHSKQSISSISEQDNNIVQNDNGKDNDKEFEQPAQQKNKLKQKDENHNDILQSFSSINANEQLNNVNGMIEEQQLEQKKTDEFQINEQNQQQNNFNEQLTDLHQSNKQQQYENQILQSKDQLFPPHFPNKSMFLTQIPISQPQIENIEILQSLSLKNSIIEQEKQNTQENQIEDNYKKIEKYLQQSKEQQDQQRSNEQQDQLIHSAPPGLDKPEQDLQYIPQIESSSSLQLNSYSSSSLSNQPSQQLPSSYLSSLSLSISSSSSQLQNSSKTFEQHSSSLSQYYSQLLTRDQQFQSSPSNINASLSQSSQIPLITQNSQQPLTFKQQSYPENLQNAQQSSNFHILNNDSKIENIHHLSQDNIIQQNPFINKTDQNITFTPNSISSISQYQLSPEYQNSNSFSNPTFKSSQFESQKQLQQQQIQQQLNLNQQQKLNLQEIQQNIQKLNQQKQLLEQYYQEQLLHDAKQLVNPNQQQQQILSQNINLQLQQQNQIYASTLISSNNSSLPLPSITQTNQSTSSFISSPNFNSQTPLNTQNTPPQYFMLGPFQSNSGQQQQQMVQFQPIQQQYNIYNNNFDPFNYSQQIYENNKQLKKFQSQSRKEIKKDQLQYELFHYDGRNSNKKQQFNGGKQRQKLAVMNYMKCFQCGRRGHIFENCPYHALLTATTDEETKIDLEDQQNKINQGISTNDNNNGISYDVDRDVCFRCGRPGHTSKECTFEDNRICFKCGGVGHTVKYCPENNNKKITKRDLQQDKK